MLQDLQLLAEALEDNVDLFAHDQRNFGAQQVRYTLLKFDGVTRVLIMFLCLHNTGQGAARPEELERQERNRAVVLDDRQLDRAGLSKY